MVWKSDFFSWFMRFVRVPPYENWAFWTNFYFSWENGEFFWGQTCCTLFHTKNEEKSQKISTCIRIHTRVYAITWGWGLIGLIFCAAENIFSVSKYIPHFYFLVLFSSERNIFSLSKCNVPFPSLFYFSSAKKNSFSKYPPPFPSLFIFSSKDPKLKIQES